jgi:hypothetical protein
MMTLFDHQELELKLVGRRYASNSKLKMGKYSKLKMGKYSKLKMGKYSKLKMGKTSTLFDN